MPLTQEIAEKKQNIVTTLTEKSLLKQKVYDNTLQSFSSIKEILKTLSVDLNKIGRAHV